jgi:hypothetical protein
MKYHVSADECAYTGEQLRSSFAYTVFDILGDSIVAFCGPCDVKTERVVDIEDLKEGNRIYSESMLHFIIEHYDTDLEKAVLRQVMFASLVKEMMNHRLKESRVRRMHTDLYDGDAKLSVSVATVTPLSSLIHFGINITSKNTPVKTKGLADYGIDPLDFAHLVAKEYVAETKKVHDARCKVRWVE